MPSAPAAPVRPMVYAHVFLNEESGDKMSFSYYPSGHMFYLEKASFDQFREQTVDRFGRQTQLDQAA